MKTDCDNCEKEGCPDCCQHDDIDGGYCTECEAPAHEFLNWE